MLVQSPSRGVRHAVLMPAGLLAAEVRLVGSSALEVCMNLGALTYHCVLELSPLQTAAAVCHVSVPTHRRLLAQQHFLLPFQNSNLT